MTSAKQTKTMRDRPKTSKRLFSGMGYREVQRSNSKRRSRLDKATQKRLKTEGYKNVGWDNVIALYQKINDIAFQPDPQEDTLEDLFLKADRIGSRYQSAEEIAQFNQKLAAEVDKIGEKIEQQFPEPEGGEFIDFSQPSAKTKSVKGKSTKKKSAKNKSANAIPAVR